MPGLIETAQVGVRQDLSDYIVQIQQEDTPLFSMLPKDTVRAATFDTQVDDYGDTDNIDGVGSNEDASTFKNMAENRGTISNSVMKMWELPMVDDFAENVNENEALPKGEYTEAVRKATVRLKFRAEKLLMSRVEAQKQTNGTKYRTCSIGGFVNSSAPTGTQTVPSAFRTPSAQIYTSTLAALTEADITKILQEIFESTNGMGKFTGFFGSELKRTVSTWQMYSPTVSNFTSIRYINQDVARTLETRVDILSGDFGTVTLIPTTRIGCFDSSAASVASALRRKQGLILDITRWGLAFKRKPGHKAIENKGGGPRGMVDMIFGLRCKAPKCNGAVYCSS